MEYLRCGDTLAVWKLDRLGRSVKEGPRSNDDSSCANGPVHWRRPSTPGPPPRAGFRVGYATVDEFLSSSVALAWS
jgi:hypothetical protein